MAAVTSIAAVVTVPWFAGVGVAEDPIPAEKQAVIDAPTPDPGAIDSSADPIMAPRADYGDAGQIRGIKRDIPGLLARFNHAQILSVDLTTRQAEAEAVQADIQYASSLGTTAFVQGAQDGAGGGPNGQEASQFRKDMVAALDSSVVIQQSITISDQLVMDAREPNFPSLTDSKFTITEWQGVQVTGTSAKAFFIASYSNCFGGGSVGNSCVDPLDSEAKQWVVNLRLGTDGIWRMYDFDAHTYGPGPVQ